MVYGGSAAYDIAKQQIIGVYTTSGALAVDTVARRIFSSTSTGLNAYNMDTFALVGTDTAYKNPSTNTQLVRWGRYGIAYMYSADYYGAGATLYVGKTTLVP